MYTSSSFYVNPRLAMPQRYRDNEYKISGFKAFQKFKKKIPPKKLILLNYSVLQY